MEKIKYKDFSDAVESFFCKYLIQERNVSHHTIRAYRDSFALFLEYMNKFHKTPADKIDLEHVNRQNIIDYLIWLESEKQCAPQTKALRLASMKSFSTYLIYEDPVHMAQWKSISSIKTKVIKRETVNYLTVEGLTFLLEEIPSDDSNGRRNLTMLSLLYYTGARVQELINLTPASIRECKPYIIELFGKGDKKRIVPISDKIMKLLKMYLHESKLNISGRESSPLFSNCWGEKLTNQGIAYIINKYVASARLKRPDLIPAKISPHCFRHSRAMHLLESGVNLIYIRDLLGHISIQTTEIYARADSKAKREAIEAAYQPSIPQMDAREKIWEKDKKIIEFLKSLA
jgi:site-specific recombinase XerD